MKKLDRIDGVIAAQRYLRDVRAHDWKHWNYFSAPFECEWSRAKRYWRKHKALESAMNAQRLRALPEKG